MEIIIEKIKTYDKGKFAGFEYIFHFMGKSYTMQDRKFKFLFKQKLFILHPSDGKLESLTSHLL